jgi:hypothetical protein
MRYVMTLTSLLLLLICPLMAQQNPYFVTYDHHLEERQNLEISTQSTIGIQKRDRPTYLGQLLELEYGVTSWWSSALYLEGASQHHDSTVFAGFRLENRFKPFSERKINPVFYFEYENINEASRIRKDIVGHAAPSDESLSELRGETAQEIEAKLIFSSDLKNWSIAENFIVEKNLSEDEGFEFGYALGVFRPLPVRNLSVGLELYGGLGSTEQFGFKDTAHYLAPVLVWNLVRNQAFKLSPGFGLTANGDRMLLRFGYTYEINGFGQKVSRLLGISR